MGQRTVNKAFLALQAELVASLKAQNITLTDAQLKAVVWFALDKLEAKASVN